MTPDPIRVEKQDEPIKAYKSCSIVGHLDDITGELTIDFGGSGSGGNYDVPVAEMQCMRGGAHTKPELDCTCGFYGMKNYRNIMGSTWLLEVEFYGEVIEGMYDGYRAQKQRVLSITPQARCQICDAGKGRYANVICWNFAGPLIPVCWSCAREDGNYVIPWDMLARLCPVEWKRPFMFRYPENPPKHVTHIHNRGKQGGSLDLPADLRGCFSPGQTYMMQAPIMVNASSYFVFRLTGDQNRDGFRLEMECDAYRIGEWHFQVPKDAKGWRDP